MATSGFGSRTVIHITKGYNLHIGTLGEFSDIAFPLATGTDAGNAELVTGCYKSPTDYVTGNNGESRHANGTGFDELPSLVCFV